MQPDIAESHNTDTLFLGLSAGKNFGWGICSQYLIQELSALTDVHVLSEADGSAANGRLPGKLFVGLTNEDFYPLFEQARGRENYGYTFFENELSATSVTNAKRYDTVLAGSSWCRDRMLEQGIANCAVLLQGIDPTKFYPVETQKTTDSFVIFSGGKFELRKGQDLVLRALKIVQDKYSDIVLVNCWYNMWPQSVRLMNASPHIRMGQVDTGNWIHFMQEIYTLNGLNANRIKTLDIVPNYILRQIYAQTDIGLFPNRCEGGTNLVLMEYMACGKPVIVANNSGHRDVVGAENAILLEHMAPFNLNDNRRRCVVARWEEPSLDEIVAKIEYAYHHRDEIRGIGRRAGERMKSFTWRQSAQSLMSSLGM
jgi:glycosyltransferase involved in cell wall biosynthesis